MSSTLHPQVDHLVTFSAKAQPYEATPLLMALIPALFVVILKVWYEWFLIGLGYFT